MLHNDSPQDRTTNKLFADRRTNSEEAARNIVHLVLKHIVLIVSGKSYKCCFVSTISMRLAIIIIIIIIISFLQGIYTYIPQTNYVRREYSVAAILLLLFMVLISLVSVLNLLYFYISTFRSMCAVPNMAVFWSSLTSCFPGMLLAYFLKDFEIVPVTPIFTGITFLLHSTCAVLLL